MVYGNIHLRFPPLNNFYFLVLHSMVIENIVDVIVYSDAILHVLLICDKELVTV